MGKIILLSLILYLSCPLSAPGESSPMVERHIFSPESDGKGSYKSPMSLKLEKDLMFTGVVISSKGKWAIIRETGKMNEEKVSGLRKEGDEIMGMVIKKIGSNFLILAGEGKEVRLNLYQEGKSRPPMLAGSESPSMSAEEIPTEIPAASSKSSAPGTGARSTSPYPQTSKPPTKVPEEKNQETPPNPFLKEGQNPFLKQNPNPFLQEQPPNPYQEQPPNAEGN